MELRDKVARNVKAEKFKRTSRASSIASMDAPTESELLDADAAIATVMEVAGWRDISGAEIQQCAQNELVLVLLPDGRRLVAKYAPINGCGYAWFAEISNGNFCNEVYPVKFMPLPPPPFERTKHD